MSVMRPSEAPSEHREPPLRQDAPPEIRRRLDSIRLLTDARMTLRDSIAQSNGVERQEPPLRPTDMAYAFERSHENPAPTWEQRQEFARLNLRFAPGSERNMPRRRFSELESPDFGRIA